MRRDPVVFLFGLSLLALGAVVLPLWKPLLIAAVLAGTLSGWHDRVAEAWGGRRSLSAVVFTLGIVVMILLPLGIATYFIVEQGMQLVDIIRRTLAAEGLAGLLRPLPDPLEHWLRSRYQESLERPSIVFAHLDKWVRSGWAMNALATVVSATSEILFALLMMLIATFFLLRDGHRFVTWLEDATPAPRHELDELLADFGATARSVIGGNVLTGLAQAIAASVGYAIARVPSPVFVGLLTFITSFIPSVGTALIGLPTVGLLLLFGKTKAAIFLGAWMLVVVGLIDNFIRPLLLRGPANMNGALVFFALMGGILFFGAMGLVVGPLALAFFLTMTSLLHRRRTRNEAA
jgi:predicted PurR-regulated permease PerM